jgi:hypothetical protein
LACLAEGLGIRATARVFEVAPNTVLSWLVEAAGQLTAFADSFLCDVHVRQLHLDEWYAVLRGVTTGKLSEEQAIKRLERSRPWVWTAIDPPSKLLVAMDVGARTLEMAQRMVHQVARRVAPTCVPLCLSEGFTGYLPPPSWVIVASGGSLSVAKRKARGPSRVGCRCPGSSLRRSSSSTGVDAW